MGRILIISIIGFCSLFGGAASHAGPHHTYVSGVVQRLDNGQVAIAAGTYTLLPGVTVVRLERESNGAHYQRKGSLSDVRPGDRVYLKTFGRKVAQIEVER